jgi:hypothetical protein
MFLFGGNSDPEEEYKITGACKNDAVDVPPTLTDPSQKPAPPV